MKNWLLKDILKNLSDCELIKFLIIVYVCLKKGNKIMKYWYLK